MAYLIKLTRSAGRIAYNFCKRTASTSFSPIAYSEEILQAKTKDSPIVALESTIITHGMPYPQNLKTALEVENIIRGRGATPATVAILKGQLTVGLSEDQLSYLAQAKSAVKTSRRDLGPVLAAKRDGATTVAGTIIAADLAGIPVFVTGGIGGVHREGEHTLDISADLTELGRSSTLVVCSGVKSILDIGKTLEYLETQGVCVCAYGDTDEFPAFYTRRSGHRAPYCTATPHEAALLIHASKTLRLKSGIVVAVPIPEEYAMDELLIENAIEEALKDANLEGIKGKEVTPFILAAVARATEGASLDANIALIKNNAKVGADIAVELKKLKDINNLENSRNVGSSSSTKLSPGSRRGFHTSCCSRFKVQTGGGSDFPLFGSERKSEGDVLVIGGANVDRSYRLKEQEVQQCMAGDFELLETGSPTPTFIELLKFQYLNFTQLQQCMAGDFELLETGSPTPTFIELLKFQYLNFTQLQQCMAGDFELLETGSPTPTFIELLKFQYLNFTQLQQCMAGDFELFETGSPTPTFIELLKFLYL